MANAVSTNQLIDHVAERTGLSKKDAKAAVSAVFEAMGEQLASGQRLQLSGFGTFEVRERAERHGTNPRTREKVLIPASKAVAFRPAAGLKQQVGSTAGNSETDT